MRSVSRRNFLQDASKTGLAVSASLAFGSHLFDDSRQQARAGLCASMPTRAER